MPPSDIPGDAPAPAPDLHEILDRGSEEPPDPAPAVPEPDPVAPAAPAAAEPPAEGGEAPAPASLPEGESESDTFPRTYVEELRQENAKYRTTARPFIEAFDGYNDEARDVMLGIVRDLVVAPENAAGQMIEVARELLGDRFDEYLSDPSPKPLTQDDLEREFQRREAQRQEAEAVAAVQREAKELGYDDESPEAVMLYGLAAKFHGGDLRAADKYLKDLEQAAVAKYLESKSQQAESFPPVTAGSITPSAETEAPKDFAEARKRFLAMP